jgi:peptidoglycan hydrolase-like protein with peptidoglycan-binding domain
MPTVQPGSSGPDVKALQQKLKDLGFDPDGVDGNFGAGTKKAVIAFQQSKGLLTDGVVGPGTQAALDAAATAITGDASVTPVSDDSSTASSDSGVDPAGSGSEGAAAVGGAITSGVVPATAPVTSPNLNLAGLAGKIPDAVLAQIPEAAAEFGITTNLRLAHFLAQCALESTGFTATVENLNYSAECLCPESSEDRQPSLCRPNGQWRRGFRRWIQVPRPRLHSINGQEQLHQLYEVCRGRLRGQPGSGRHKVSAGFGGILLQLKQHLGGLRSRRE